MFRKEEGIPFKRMSGRRQDVNLLLVRRCEPFHWFPDPVETLTGLEAKFTANQDVTDILFSLVHEWKVSTS